MSLRISSAVLGGTLGLVSCAPAAGPPPGEVVECAPGPGARWARACTLEREAVPGRFVLHHPGGGFRRVRFDAARRELAPADGAEQVSGQKIEGKALVFTLAGTGYRIPLSLLAGEP